MKWYIRLGVIYVLRVLLIFFYIFPIKNNRILFSSEGGMTYKCNPRFIFEALYSEFEDKFEFIWSIKDKNKIPTKYKVKNVLPLSLRHLYYLMTSKVVISNVGIEPFVPPRKGRIFINTWHGGGAYKKGGLSATYYSKAHRYYFKKIRNLRAKSTTFLISSNARFSKIFADEFKLKKEQILPIGMPRNDIFFSPGKKQEEVREFVCRKYNIPNDSFIVLYAPTYRGHEANCQHIDWSIDVEKICDAVYQRFGKKPVVLYRCHINVFNDRQQVKDAIDVSEYYDIQDLLVSADLLISDYSSLIWDYSFTWRPGFLYTPDLDQYREVTKLHTPIEQWQYPFALTHDDLCNQILRYNEVNAKSKIKSHHDLLGSYENGKATEYVKNL
ncbi:MAG: CDP-glycerol glycerophosphotransferase family protein, partial [Ruminococcus sp.]|nr:CDP-glycerol glycerophosphotransferase family protein [Ruminococcus sp.]